MQQISCLADIAQATAAANRIQAMRISYPSDDRTSDLAECQNDNSSGVKIEFSNIWFRYPARDAPVLNGLNMTVNQTHAFLRCIPSINEP